MDMSPRYLAAGTMFSGQGGAVYAEMAPEPAWIAGGAWSGDGLAACFSSPDQSVRRLEQPLSNTLPSSGRVGVTAALQREEPAAAVGRTHGMRHQADVRFGHQRWLERQLYVVQLTAGLRPGGPAAPTTAFLPCELGVPTRS